MKRTEYRKFDGKRICIWGYGSEGKSTEQFLARCCRPQSVEIFEGKREEIDEDRFDFIIKSPGIAMDEDHPKYTSQTEIFLEAFRDQVIGITGTKGKSTTAAMLYHVLKEERDRPVLFLGNIGEPCLDHYEQMDEETLAVFEMSCHQLAHAKVSPHIAVILNLFEEHLDYYGTMEKYFAAKRRITTYQTESDYVYLGSHVPPLATKAIRIVIDAERIPSYRLQLLGEHNRQNAEFVFRIATERCGITPEAVRESLAAFTGLAHRLQKLGERNGITYYDDSISTIPNATIAALQAVENASAVIIGGMDRGIDYAPLEEYIRKHPEYHYVFAYDSGKRIYEAVKECPYCFLVTDLEEAVAVATELTPQGKACILSPASASYGYFRNFEERGDRFRALAGFGPESVE